MRYFLFVTAMIFSGSVFGQVIDAQSYIHKNGFQKKALAGSGTFYTIIKRVNAEEISPYMEAVKEMSRTEEANKLCRQQAIGVQKQFDVSSKDSLKLSQSIGYGGPQDGKFGCVFFIESQGSIAAAQVYFLKIVPKGNVYESFTVIVTH